MPVYEYATPAEVYGAVMDALSKGAPTFQDSSFFQPNLILAWGSPTQAGFQLQDIEGDVYTFRSNRITLSNDNAERLLCHNSFRKQLRPQESGGGLSWFSQAKTKLNIAIPAYLSAVFNFNVVSSPEFHWTYSTPWPPPSGLPGQLDYYLRLHVFTLDHGTVPTYNAAAQRYEEVGPWRYPMVMSLLIDYKAGGNFEPLYQLGARSAQTFPQIWALKSDGMDPDLREALNDLASTMNLLGNRTEAYRTHTPLTLGSRQGYKETMPSPDGTTDQMVERLAMGVTQLARTQDVVKRTGVISIAVPSANCIYTRATKL